MRQKCRGYGWLFLTICVIYLCTVSDSYWGWISDGRVMFETAVSLHEFGELEILPESAPNSGNFEQTRHFGKYGIGFSIVQQVPLFFAASVEKALGGGRSNVLFALTNMILTAFTALVVALCLRDLGFRYRTGVLAAIGFAFATFAWPYISYDFSEPLQSLCLVASFWLLIRAATSTPPSRLLLGLAGLVLGFAVLTKAFLLILIPGYALYLWLRLGALQKHRSLAWFALPLGFWCVCIAALNLYRFGSVFDFGYGDEGSRFTTPLLTGLYGLVLSPNKGLLFYAPLTALVPWSLWKMRKNHRCEFIFFVSIIALHLLPTSKWWSWEGGTSWGPRLLLPILPLLVICAAMLLDSVSRSLTPFVACVIAGFGINLLGLLIYFVAWDHIVGLNPARVPLDVTGRPTHEYVEQGGKRWFDPFIAISYVPGLSPILGHAWLLRLRYFDTPFSIKALNNESSGPLPTVNFPPLELNFELMRNSSRFNLATWLLRSAHFWLFETIWQRPREDAFTFSIYTTALGKEAERAILQRNPQRALQCYRRMVELMPNSADVAIKLAQVHLQLGKRLEAQQALVQFLDRHPEEAQVRLQLAQLFELSGKTREALDTYYTYRTLHPGDANMPMVQQRITALSARRGQ